jgi:FkbM family methyltransferase
MALVLHLLRPGDLFVDVGANVGSYTILASATGADVLCFEPVRAAFESLLDNIHLNRLENRVEARYQAVGRATGELEMIADQDTTNQALRAGDAYAGKTIRVPVVSLDDALNGKVPKVIKIDVEGYETEVFAGAEETLANPALQGVVMELNGSGKRYGYDEDKLHQQMLDIGLSPYRYEPGSRTIIDLDGIRPGTGNTLYLRDAEVIQQELLNAPGYRVLGSTL